MTASLFQPEFGYTAAPQRVVFATMAQSRVASEVMALGKTRAVVGDPAQP